MSVVIGIYGQMTLNIQIMYFICIYVCNFIINCLSDSSSSVEFHSGSPFNSIPEETGKDIQEGLYRRGLFYPQTFTRLKLCLALNGFLL